MLVRIHSRAVERRKEKLSSSARCIEGVLSQRNRVLWDEDVQCVAFIVVLETGMRFGEGEFVPCTLKRDTGSFNSSEYVNETVLVMRVLLVDGSFFAPIRAKTYLRFATVPCGTGLFAMA